MINFLNQKIYSLTVKLPLIFKKLQSAFFITLSLGLIIVSVITWLIPLALDYPDSSTQFNNQSSRIIYIHPAMTYGDDRNYITINRVNPNNEFLSRRKMMYIFWSLKV